MTSGKTITSALGGMALSLSAAAELPRDAVWIDVRSPGEYQQGHLQGAHSIPFDGIEVGVAKLALEKDAPIYLYCGSGKRAGIALERLQAQGFEQVTNVGGLEDARSLAEPSGN